MIKQPLLQYMSTQTDVTASRNITGTIYQNLGSKPIFCLLTLDMGLNGQVTGYSDASNTPATQILAINNLNLANIVLTLTFLVLPNYYYQVLRSGAGTLQRWIEYS